MCTGETVDQSNCVQLPRDIMCLPIGSMLLRSKILWMKHVVFWREPDGVIPRATGDWLTGRWDSRKVLRHCHNTWKTSTYARRCWSSRFWHSDWKSGLFPDFYRKYSKVRTFPGPVWDDILTPLYIDPGVNISYDILTPGSIYRNDILTPLTIFWPPPNSTQNSLVGYDQLLNVAYCYLYMIFMNSERIG